MNQTLRSLAAGATGALVMAAIVLGQPALAGQLDKAAAKNSVTSKSIKNGAIKTKDLSAEVTGPLAKANTALQGIPDNGVSNSKMADNAVGSAEVTADSLAAADLAPNSVGASEVTNGSLALADVATRQGFVSQDLGSIAAGACTSFDFDAGDTILGGVTLVSPSFALSNGLTVSNKVVNGNADNIRVYVCNVTGAPIDPPSTSFFWAVLG